MTVRRISGAAAAAVMLAMVSAEAKPLVEPGRWSRPESAVVVHGRDKSFGALGDVLASGQELAKAPVNGWAFPAGSRPGRTVVAADGTVLMASTALTIGVYDPRANAFTAIRLPSPAGPRETGPAVTDLLPLSADAVAFAVAPAGPGPVFGVLTKVNGAWQAMPANMFTGAQLGTEGLQGLALLPGSGQLLLVHSAISVLKLYGPDRAGHYLPEITTQYRYPLSHLSISAQTVRADPTGMTGDERFVMGLRNPKDAALPQVMQEFSYDQRAGSVRPVSAPLLPGAFHRDTGRAYGFDHAIYDGMGNLWVTSSHGREGGRLAVYARTGDGRRPGSATCPFSPAKVLESYVTREPNGRKVWGQACPADYQLLQAKDLGISSGLVADPASGTVVSILDDGRVMAFRAQESGAALRFTAGNLLDIGRKVLPIASGDFLEQHLGAVDAQQRLWFPVSHSSPHPPSAPLDQWLISVELDDLFEPRPVRLPDTPGQVVTIQAERSLTVGTEARKISELVTEIDSLTYARACSDSPHMIGCGYDQSAGDGFVVADDHVYGHLGGALSYRVEVATAGTYRLSYQAGTFESRKVAAIELSVAGRVLVTPVSSDGGWRVFRSKEDIQLSAGTHVLTLSAPPATAGWFLNSFSLQRL